MAFLGFPSAAGEAGVGGSVPGRGVTGVRGAEPRAKGTVGQRAHRERRGRNTHIDPTRPRRP